MAKRHKEQEELKQFKRDVAKEVKQLRKDSQLLRESNIKYKKTIISLKYYLEKLHVSDGAATGEAPVPFDDSRSGSSHLRD